MTRRFNIRVSDGMAEQVGRVAREVAISGGDGSISQVARRLIEEGLRSFEAEGRSTETNYEKGQAFEVQVFEDIKKALWDAEVEHLKPRPGGRCPDIRGPFFDVECKAGKRPSTRQALKQIRESAAENQSGIAVICDDGERPFVVLDWNTFLSMWRAVYELSIFAEDLPRRLKRVETDSQ